MLTWFTSTSEFTSTSKYSLDSLPKRVTYPEEVNIEVNILSEENRENAQEMKKQEINLTEVNKDTDNNIIYVPPTSQEGQRSWVWAVEVIGRLCNTEAANVTLVEENLELTSEAEFQRLAAEKVEMAWLELHFSSSKRLSTTCTPESWMWRWWMSERMRKQKTSSHERINPKLTRAWKDQSRMRLQFQNTQDSPAWSSMHSFTTKCSSHQCTIFEWF